MIGSFTVCQNFSDDFYENFTAVSYNFHVSVWLKTLLFRW